MEDLQTDTLSDYGKTQNNDNIELDSSKDSENVCAASLLNGCEELDNLDLMADHCNESIGSNSDIWKGSDSEDENLENKEKSQGDKSVEEQNSPSKEVNKSDLISEPPPAEPENISEEEPTSTDQNVEETSAVESEEKSENKIESECAKEASDGDKANIETGEADKESPSENNEPTAETKEADNESSTETKEADKEPPDQAKEVNKDSPDQVTNDEDPLRTDATQDKDPLTTDATQEKDPLTTDATQEKDPLTTDTTQEKDPLTTDATQNKDPLTTDPTQEKDPLTTDAIQEQDPLAADAEKNPLEGRHPNSLNEGQNNDDCQMDYDAADDEDFDPSLLCPEVSMDVDESPVITNSGPVPNESGSDSPLPYEPLFSTFVDEVTGAEISFNMTSEELELRKRLYGPTNPVQCTRLHCTACNKHLGSALEGQNNRFVHPLLKVMICKECYHFYTSGDFDKDEDGSELYCRWCGQGGQVLCCSKCEFVFCKRCIRTNFGRKKMFEIRDSDSWECFRCNPSQIITQRIACYEFFEYVRREMQRAATLTESEIWSRDYSRCCQPKKRQLENGEEKKAKRKKGATVDPDYDPLADKPEKPPESTNLPSHPNPVAFVNKGIVLPKPIQILPRPPINRSRDNDIEFVRQIPAPHMTITSLPRPQFRTMTPLHIRPGFQPQPTYVRINTQPVPPLVPTANRLLSAALNNRNMPNNLLKHEWFEKTVRAAARVNSHLSYTLTQLNKAQSQAASVEELAVVHNKLQEILSSSINSLIQIRKNLRTEFIAGIKTVRLPSKKPDLNHDDDVIFVSTPTTMSIPSTSDMRAPAKDPLIIIDKSNMAVGMLTTPTPANKETTKMPMVSTGQQKGYLKVKSVLELQNVPAECITIPDDTPPLKANDDKATKEKDVKVEVVCNGSSNVEKPDDKATKKTEKPDDKTKKTPEPVKTPRTRRSKNDQSHSSYNLKGEPSPEIKKMMSVKIFVKNEDLEALQKKYANKS